ncbi:hypothetical protein ES707_21649 [subsurface metagenome]
MVCIKNWFLGDNGNGKRYQETEVGLGTAESAGAPGGSLRTEPVAGAFTICGANSCGDGFGCCTDGVTVSEANVVVDRYGDAVDGRYELRRLMAND